MALLRNYIGKIFFVTNCITLFTTYHNCLWPVIRSFHCVSILRPLSLPLSADVSFPPCLHFICPVIANRPFLNIPVSIAVWVSVSSCIQCMYIWFLVPGLWFIFCILALMKINSAFILSIYCLTINFIFGYCVFCILNQDRIVRPAGHCTNSSVLYFALCLDWPSDLPSLLLNGHRD